MDREVVLSPVHPPKSTAAAYNVYPFSGGWRDGNVVPAVVVASTAASQRSLFFGALNYRPELWNSSLERIVCTCICGWMEHDRV